MEETELKNQNDDLMLNVLNQIRKRHSDIIVVFNQDGIRIERCIEYIDGEPSDDWLVLSDTFHIIGSGRGEGSKEDLREILYNGLISNL